MSSKGRAKRTQHRQESDKVNRTAFWVGGAIAGITLAVVIASVLL